MGTLSVWLLAFTSIFSLVDPFAAIPAFLVMTAGDDAARRRRTAKRARNHLPDRARSFRACGSYIFRIFGITLPAFEIAGGIILALIGLDMLQARRSSTQEVPPTAARAPRKKTSHHAARHPHAGRTGSDLHRHGADRAEARGAEGHTSIRGHHPYVP